MNSSDIIFNNLIAILNGFLDEPTLETFIQSLSPSDEVVFVGITERIRTIVTNLDTAKSSDIFPSDYAELKTILDLLDTRFELFTFTGGTEIRFLAMISALLADEGLDLTDKSVVPQINNFELGQALQLDPTMISNFLYENATYPDESVFVIDFSSPEDFNHLVTTNRPSALLLLILAHKLSISSAVEKRKYILVKTGGLAQMNSSISSILFHYVSAGLSFHQPKSYTSFTPNKWSDNILLSNKYQQFQTTLYVLSEYNNSSDILSRYLLIYHVFEEYMYKSSLVKLEGVNNGKMFSMRDFSRMNESIAKKELEALITFFKKACAITVSPGRIVSNVIYTNWTTFITSLVGTQPSDIEVFMNALAVSSSGSFTIGSIVRENDLVNVLPKIIYMTRNSIVHNKSTEFHLTYLTLNESMYLFINKFLIPCLEEIVFFLTTNPNTELVWFTHSSLVLWEE